MGNLDGSTEASSVDSASLDKSRMLAELSDPEKHAPVEEPSTAVAESTTENKETGLEKEGQQETEGTEDEDIEYPAKWRLTLITIALCLSVFCMALVGSPSRSVAWSGKMTDRAVIG